jgi:hypothetical protein
VSSLLPGSGTIASGVDTAYGRSSTIAFGAGDTPFQASVTGLLPGVTYHVRVTVQNANGATVGPDQTVTTLPLAPAVAPVQLTGVTTTTATLSAAVNPNGGTTDAYVEYGPTTSYGQTAAHVSVPAQNAYAPQTFALTDLEPDTAYHARVTATNPAGTRSAADIVFTTPPLPPTIGSLAAQTITQDGFDVVATIDPHGKSGSWQLSLGTSAGALQPRRSDVFAAGQSSVAVSVARVGWPLLPATTYYVQLSVTTAGGTATSDVRAVTTAPLPAPTIGAVTATPEITIAALGARVRGNGLATSVSFQYGTTSAYGHGSLPVPIPADQLSNDYLAGAQIGGLAPSTTYHFRVAAANSTGTSYSSDQTFTTAAAQAPTISGLGTSQIDRHSATAKATIDAGSAQTPATTYAEFGTDTRYGARVDAVPTQAGSVAFPLTGLRYGTTVHWRVVAQSAGGTTQSPDQTFTTLAPLPPAFASYGAPTAVTTTSAVVSAGVAEYDVDGTVLVEYGPTTAYGLQTMTQALGAVPEGQTAAVAVPLAGLQPGATIHYRFVAQNASGTTRSADQTLRTLYPPDVVAVGAFTVAPDSASVPVAIDAHGIAGSAYVEYGADAGYGQGGVQEPLAAVDGPQQVTLPLVALAAGTSYHFRVVATTANGSGRSADGTFTTAPWPLPVVASGAASAVDMTSALVSGTVTAVGLSASARFEYGPTTAYGQQTTIQTLPARGGAQTIRAALAGLTPNTTYHWRATAQNATGTAVGADQTFTTLALLHPVVTPPTVGAPSATAATVAAQVGSNRLATTVYLEYGTTSAYGTTTPVRSLGASTALVSQQFALSGLAPATTYHLRVVARNAGGTAATPDRTFTTALLLAPSAETGGATRIGAGSAVVSVRVANNNRATAWWVEYGTGNAYGLRTQAVALTVAGQRTLAVLLPNLLPVTEYHWRVVAKSDGGTTVGDDASFETLAAPSDATDPVAAIRLPACGARGASACAAFRATAAAWATLTGTATDSGRGASGVATVETNVYRALPGGVCQAFDGLDFQPMPCDRADDVWVPATYAAGAFKTALRKLATGTYTLRARATDWAGNTQGVFRSGANSLTLKLSG